MAVFYLKLLEPAAPWEYVWKHNSGAFAHNKNRVKSAK